jgi:predicted amidophosphoribosyltransferase
MIACVVANRQGGLVVIDDICTTGGQLDTVAAALLDDGRAQRVQGLVLGRAPWLRR